MRLSDVVSHSGLSIYAVIALVIFLAAFVGIVVRVFTAKRRDMDHQARLPLEDAPSASKESDDE